MQVKSYHSLEQKHWFAHDYCFMLHDILVDTLIQIEKSGLHNVILDLNDQKDLQEKLNLNLNSGKNIFNILEEGGQIATVFELLYKQVCMGLLSDMGHFIYEALQCSIKGKLTVTFALLRKPFTENLLYLEYLLNDPGTFIYKFWKDDMNYFGLGRDQKIKPKELICDLYDKYKMTQFESPEDIWKLRYDKTSSESFQTYFQHATHLVTQAKQYKTSSTNFNFIFSNQKDMHSQWEGLYSYLPALLMHTVQVTEALFSIFGKRAAIEHDITEQRITVGYILWKKYSFWGDYGRLDVMEQLKSVENLNRYNCPNCLKETESTFENYMSFYDKGEIKCNDCAHNRSFIREFEIERDYQFKMRSDLKK